MSHELTVPMNKVIGLVGAGGFGSEAMPLLQLQLNNTLKEQCEVFFIDSEANLISL